MKAQLREEFIRGKLQNVKLVNAPRLSERIFMISSLFLLFLLVLLLVSPIVSEKLKYQGDLLYVRRIDRFRFSRECFTTEGLAVQSLRYFFIRSTVTQRVDKTDALSSRELSRGSGRAFPPLISRIEKKTLGSCLIIPTVYREYRRNRFIDNNNNNSDNFRVNEKIAYKFISAWLRFSEKQAVAKRATMCRGTKEREQPR